MGRLDRLVLVVDLDAAEAAAILTVRATTVSWAVFRLVRKDDFHALVGIEDRFEHFRISHEVAVRGTFPESSTDKLHCRKRSFGGNVVEICVGDETRFAVPYAVHHSEGVKLERGAGQDMILLVFVAGAFEPDKLRVVVVFKVVCHAASLLCRTDMTRQ